MVTGRPDRRSGSVIILPPVAHAAAAAPAPEIVVEPPAVARSRVDSWEWVKRAAAIANLIRLVRDALSWLSFRRQPAA